MARKCAAMRYVPHGDKLWKWRKIKNVEASKEGVVAGSLVILWPLSLHSLQWINRQRLAIKCGRRNEKTKTPINYHRSKRNERNGSLRQTINPISWKKHTPRTILDATAEDIKLTNIFSVLPHTHTHAREKTRPKTQHKLERRLKLSPKSKYSGNRTKTITVDAYDCGLRAQERCRRSFMCDTGARFFITFAATTTMRCRRSAHAAFRGNIDTRTQSP